MVEHQPALVGEERHGACADLGALPCAVLEGGHLHEATVFAPVFHVGRVGDEYVAEGCVAVVGWARHHGVASAYLLREKHAVAVEGEEGVLALVETLEVERVADADRGAVAPVAPCDPPAVFNPGDAGIVLVVGAYHRSVARLELDGRVRDFPVYAVGGEAGVYVHLDGLVVATEHSGVSVAEGDHCGIEYGV